MEGKAAASRGAYVFDPLALTLGSIYASAATAAAPASPPPPPAPATFAPRPAPRRLNNGTALSRAAAIPAPAASPPPAPTVAQRAALLRLNNDMALIRAAAAAGAPASPAPPPLTVAAPHAALRRLDKGKAVMYAAAVPAPPSRPPPLTIVAPHSALHRLDKGKAIISAAAVPAPPSRPPPLTVVAPHSALRRLDKGKAVMYAGAPSSPPPPPPVVSPHPTYRRRLNEGLAPIYVPTSPPSPPSAPPSPPSAPPSPPAPPSTPVAPPRAIIHHHRRGVNRAIDLLVQVPPFPWATERPAQHGTLQSLLRRGVTAVVGRARCKRCGAWKAIAYDLETKFWELRGFIVANRHGMDDRAPRAWEYPALPDCGACGHRGGMWPEIADNKLQINWLFLFLGQMLGCCTLEQLKYFCMNNGQHRTGAKNRVLYYAYIEMSNQLLSFV